MSPTTRARKCLAISTWGHDNTVKAWALFINAIRTSTIKTMLPFTSERLKSPKSLQRSQTVFNPTSRMTNRPTNFTPSAPARFTPVSTSHSHQEAVKGLKTTSTTSIFFLANNHLVTKISKSKERSWFYLFWQKGGRKQWMFQLFTWDKKSGLIDDWLIEIIK